jgi:hypothetical protein
MADIKLRQRQQTLFTKVIADCAIAVNIIFIFPWFYFVVKTRFYLVFSVLFFSGSAGIWPAGSIAYCLEP